MKFPGSYLQTTGSALRLRMIKVLFALGFVALVAVLIWQYPYLKSLEDGNAPLAASLIVFLLTASYAALAWVVILIQNRIYLWKTLPDNRIQVVVKQKENPIKITEARVSTSARVAEITGPLIQGEFIICFQTDTGKNYKFNVDCKAYESCAEGDSGILIFKEKDELQKFIAFEPQALVA